MLVSHRIHTNDEGKSVDRRRDRGRKCKSKRATWNLLKKASIDTDHDGGIRHGFEVLQDILETLFNKFEAQGFQVRGKIPETVS